MQFFPYLRDGYMIPNRTVGGEHKTKTAGAFLLFQIKRHQKKYPPALPTSLPPTHTHSQDNDCRDERAPVESPPATAGGRLLLLLHLPAAVAAAATARQQDANQGHQDDVHDGDGKAHQETYFVDQDLDTQEDAHS